MAHETEFRTQPHSVKLFMSIYKPKTVLACRVNDVAIDVGEDDILYDSVTTGSYANVRPGMTVLIGSTPGTADYGRLRVRYASSTGTIRVAENSEIDWQDNLYLTVLDFYEIWSIFPNYAMDGDNVIFYKDNDTLYTNQNSNAGMGTLIHMGPHAALFVSGSLHYGSYNSISVGNSYPLSYQWSFEGGTPTGSTAQFVNVTYNTPGHFTTKLTVTTNDGVQDTSYRHISVYTPIGGTNPPIQQWELVSLKGSRSEGGYTATIRVWEDISSVVDGALVILFNQYEYYGNVAEVINGNFYRSQMFFIGYVINGSIRYDYQSSYVEFDVGSSSEIMKQQPGLSISLDSVASPTTWYELQDMDVLKTVYHYFKWHSTLLNTNDIIVTGTNYKFQYFDSEASTLYDAMQTFVQSSLLGTVVCDRENTLYIEDGPETVDFSALELNYTILRQDWMNEPDITEVPFKEVSYLELSGVAWSGVATGTWVEYISASPGNSMAYFGTVEQQTGLILTSQDMLNTLTGRAYAYRNARFPDIVMEMAGNYKTFEITPLKRYGITVLPGDTVRGINFVNKSFHINEVNWTYDPNIEYLYPEVIFHGFDNSFPGVTIIRPQTPIVNPPVQPPFELPPFPIIPIPTPYPIPPPTVPPPPPVLPGCFEDLNPPPNGPYYLSLPAEIRSDQDGYYVPFDCWVRQLGGILATSICFNGRWEKSCDGGNTWTTWTITTGLDIRLVYADGSRSSSGAISWNSYTGGSPETRCAIFLASGHIVGLEISINPYEIQTSQVCPGTAPFPITWDGTHDGVHDGAIVFTWDANIWYGTARWAGSAGFPINRAYMNLFSHALTTGSHLILVGSKPDNGVSGLPRVNYDNSSAAQVVEFADNPAGTIGANPQREGITGSWLCWEGYLDQNAASTGQYQLGHFFGEEGRSAGGSFDRTWEFQILSVDGSGPSGQTPIARFIGTVAMYNIC